MKYVKLDDIPLIYGRYYVNFKIFALGRKDVHLLLASTESETDSSYEISKWKYDKIDREI